MVRKTKIENATQVRISHQHAFKLNYPYLILNTWANLKDILKDFWCDVEADNPVIVTYCDSNIIEAFTDLEQIDCVKQRRWESCICCSRDDKYHKHPTKLIKHLMKFGMN